MVVRQLIFLLEEMAFGFGEGRFVQGEEVEAAATERGNYLSHGERVGAKLDAVTVKMKAANPVALRCRDRVHVREKDVTAKAENANALICEGIQVCEVA
jgi:hypothetical protein